MKKYVIDSLDEKDIIQLQEYFNECNLNSSLSGLFWLPIPFPLLQEEQQTHMESCGPFCMALEVLSNEIQLELLVRGTGRLHCSCTSYASEKQRNHMIAYLDEIFQQLKINN